MPQEKQQTVVSNLSYEGIIVTTDQLRQNQRTRNQKSTAHQSGLQFAPLKPPKPNLVHYLLQFLEPTNSTNLALLQCGQGPRRVGVFSIVLQRDIRDRTQCRQIGLVGGRRRQVPQRRRGRCAVVVTTTLQTKMLLGSEWDDGRHFRERLNKETFQRCYIYRLPSNTAVRSTSEQSKAQTYSIYQSRCRRQQTC